MTLSKGQRATVAARKVELYLVRQHPDLSEAAIEYLLQEAKRSAHYESHILTGEDLDLAECAASAARSEVGQLIFAPYKGDTGAVDHGAAIADMSPRQRLEYAREHNLI